MRDVSEGIYGTPESVPESYVKERRSRLRIAFAAGDGKGFLIRRSGKGSRLGLLAFSHCFSLHFAPLPLLRRLRIVTF